jgi:hypothetical protein
MPGKGSPASGMSGKQMSAARAIGAYRGAADFSASSASRSDLP